MTTGSKSNLPDSMEEAYLDRQLHLSHYLHLRDTKPSSLRTHYHQRTIDALTTR